MDVGATDIVSLVTRHGYEVLGGAVFLEALGLPVPGGIALLVAGAAFASGKLSPVAFLIAIA